jgi:hypothetical protein
MQDSITPAVDSLAEQVGALDACAEERKHLREPSKDDRFAGCAQGWDFDYLREAIATC